ncbi:cache domain-containing sensor histidine kinase [Paenibacillus hemerocallicola]|uniref:cache domain-containing sensor histidine kinase n=1 Tax=Paenibacillus hemerocallicola TaxID=1172614 RepID=UPI001FE8FF7B|nr:histidine kinase [Paenibacillus hemerocallicola]
MKIRLLRWFTRLYHQNIQLRLTIYFLFILLPLVAVSLFSTFRSQDLLVEQTTERTRTALSSSMDYIDLTLQNVEEISTVIATDSNMLRLLEKSGPGLSPQAVLNFLDLLKQLSSITSINHMISQVSIYHSPSGVLLSTTNGSKRVTNPAQQDWLAQMARFSGSGIVYTMSEEPTPEGKTFGDLIGADGISLVRVMDLNNPLRQPNLLAVTLSKAKLLNLIHSLLPSENAQIYLMNDNRKIITGSDDATAEQLSARMADEDMFTVQVNSKYYKWSLLLMQPRKEVYAKSEQMQLYTYVIIGISVLLALWISWAVYSGIASPVQKLMQGMKRAGSGNFNVKLENDRQDEFGYLTQSFNQMILDQKQLIEHGYEQQLRLAVTELKFLQTQINPHFLYNTLDSIYWAAKNYEADEISEMVLNLSRFFRLSLNKGTDTFTVEETVAHLHYYVRVQQLRFLDKFSVAYDIQEESKTIPIMKLLLQPLVENAILHGLEQRDRGGELIVRARLEDGFVHMTVTDNGVGMPQDRLRYISGELERVFAPDKPGLSLPPWENAKDLYGLRNVASRVRMVYGKRSRMEIDSREGEGTSVTVRLPLDRCKEMLQLSPERADTDNEKEAGGSV